MLFNSLEFAGFFPIVCALYFLLPHRARLPLLLIASCVFYMAFVPAYILILAVTILIDYATALGLERATGRRRRVLLGVSITATCAILGFFKYFNFFTGTLVGLATYAGWHATAPALQIILPIGLSFHTFQSLSYVVEVYRQRQRAEPNLAVFATYVMFFPQMVAGPIERPQHLLGQFREHHTFDYDRITAGLKRMAWGFFKKLVIADRLALYVNDVYAAPRDCSGPQLTLAMLFFAYQIYCDFSGYSDIAVGSAQVLGFRLMENFETPYAASSTAEFWRRWHISLSTWFRDYLYIPLGGSRVSRLRQTFNVLVTFAVSGLWHGANWTYVVWGLLNGWYLVLGRLTEGARDRAFRLLGLGGLPTLRRLTRWSGTFALTCVAWVIFRARNLGDAGYVLTHFTQGWEAGRIGTEQFLLRQLPIAVASIAVLEIAQFAPGRSWLSAVMLRWSIVPRWSAYACLAIGTLMFGVYRNSQFIYFQF